MRLLALFVVIASLSMVGCTQSPLSPSATHDIIQPTSNRVNPGSIVWSGSEDDAPKVDSNSIVWSGRE
jgi:hypothetical protein